MKIELSSMFPELDCAKGAGRWLLRAGRLRIVNQLNDVGVKKIRFVFLDGDYGLLIPPKNRGNKNNPYNGFLLVLDFRNDANGWIESLGPEIAHCWEFDPEEGDFHPNGRTKFAKSVAIKGGIRSAMESFCNAFSKLWVAVNGWQKVRKFFQNDTGSLSLATVVAFRKVILRTPNEKLSSEDFSFGLFL